MERAFGSLWIDWKNGFELWNTSIKFMRKRIFSENKAVIFDLELTSWPGTNERNWSRPNEHREIIQIGAVIIGTTGNMHEVNSFQILVCALKNPILSNYITDLTGITQEKIEKEGVPFPLGLSRFLSFIGEHPINIFCNGEDKQVLEENCRIHRFAFPSVFNHSTDLKKKFSEILGVSQKECVSSMLPKLFGFSNTEKSHDALGDARSISQVLRQLHKKEKLHNQFMK
jgi:inhibitor of KinA sporulation pathway (predicted exonuclease)